MRLQVGFWQNSLGLVVYPIPASGGGAERRRRCRSAPRDSRVAARSHKRVETERINRRPPPNSALLLAGPSDVAAQARAGASFC